MMNLPFLLFHKNNEQFILKIRRLHPQSKVTLGKWQIWHSLAGLSHCQGLAIIISGGSGYKVDRMRPAEHKINQYFANTQPSEHHQVHRLPHEWQ